MPYNIVFILTSERQESCVPRGFSSWDLSNNNEVVLLHRCARYRGPIYSVTIVDDLLYFMIIHVIVIKSIVFVFTHVI